LRNKGEDERRAGVDLYIGSDGDLKFTPAGDTQLRYGADNALQALQILLSTELGSIVRHPDYGIASGVGEPNASFAVARQKLAEAVGTQVLNDPRFDRLKTLEVESLGSASGYKVFLEVVLAGGNSVIPISFSVNVSQD
jgi:phage baseplate assembly protein W